MKILEKKKEQEVFKLKKIAFIAIDTREKG